MLQRGSKYGKGNVLLLLIFAQRGETKNELDTRAMCVCVFVDSEQKTSFDEEKSEINKQRKKIWKNIYKYKLRLPIEFDVHTAHMRFFVHVGNH